MGFNLLDGMSFGAACGKPVRQLWRIVQVRRDSRLAYGASLDETRPPSALVAVERGLSSQRETTAMQ